MKRRRTAKIVLGVTSGVLLTRVLLSFCAIGLFFHFFYARYDTLCPTDLRTSDLTAPTVPVTFDANGAALSGLRIGDGQKGVIVMIHGMRSGMDAHFAEADYFAAHGYTVFTFDGTGTRTSSGDSRCSVSFARDDLDAALDYLETTDLGSLPVFLYGHSSGGYAAATVLERADAAALLCAFDDPIDTMCDTASQYTGILVELQRPYLMLWNRINTARNYLEAHPEVKAVCSGGKGDDEHISEGRCIYEKLMQAGIAPERLYIEEESSSTKENIAFSKTLIEKEGLAPDVLLVTSDYHCFRAMQLAEKAGLKAYAWPARTASYLVPTYVLRECCGILYTWIFG